MIVKDTERTQIHIDGDRVKKIYKGQFANRLKNQVLPFLKGCDHPNIPKVLESGDDYYVMEYAGKTLKDHDVRSGLCKPEYLEQIADALFYTHCKGFSHQDLQFDNLDRKSTRLNSSHYS